MDIFDLDETMEILQERLVIIKTYTNMYNMRQCHMVEGKKIADKLTKFSNCVNRIIDTIDSLNSIMKD